MSDGVKMVFKSLLGTIAFMVLTSLCIELFNINITGMQIRYLTKLSAKHAADLFTQETYKEGNKGDANKNGGVLKTEDLKDSSGATYITGDFYNEGATHKDMYAVYDSIYDTDQFRSWCSGTSGTGFNVTDVVVGKPVHYEIKDTPRPTLLDSYSNLQAMKIGVDHTYNAYLSDPNNQPKWDWPDGDHRILEWDKYSKGAAFYDTCYTPINLGIPYLDANITNKMFRWNLGKLLTNCDPDLVQTEAMHTYTDMYTATGLDNSKKFVNYKGFKVYVDEAYIDNYEYYVFDLANVAQRTKYQNLTYNKVKETGESGEGIKVNKKRTGITGSDTFEEEDNYVAVVSISYKIPIEYIGITPLRTIFNSVWKSEVHGMEKDGRTGADLTDTNGIHEQWDNTAQNLGSGTTSDYMTMQGKSAELQDALFTTGYITYTIVN